MSKQSEILRLKLRQLQSEADKILDEIDETEAEILQIENDEIIASDEDKQSRRRLMTTNNDVQSTIDLVKEYADFKEVRSTIEELQELKKESKRLADEIETRKSKLIGIYAQKEIDKKYTFKSEVSRLCGILSESIYNENSKISMTVVETVDRDYRLIRICSSDRRICLSILKSDDDDLEKLRRWASLQIESIALYRMLLEHFNQDLISANLQQPIGIRLSDREWLEFKYQTDTDSVKIIHRSQITYKQSVDLISNAYNDGREFQASGIVDSDEIVITSSEETTCNVADFVETVEKIKLNSK